VPARSQTAVGVVEGQARVDPSSQIPEAARRELEYLGARLDAVLALIGELMDGDTPDGYTPEELEDLLAADLAEIDGLT
jgi:hypothetical protein